MKNGGFFNDPKKEIYDLIPKKYYPETKLVTKKIEFLKVVEIVEQSKIQFPLFAKPNVGLRGSAVKKIHDIQELKAYHEKADFDYLIQNMIPYSNEFGIFYVRFPHEQIGRITGIVGKEFMIITGDGKSTVEELVNKIPRYAMQLDALKKSQPEQLKLILPKEKQLNLVPYGNHIRGTKFLDKSHLISDQLTKTINEMCVQIPGFYFGRMDLMYNSLEELEQGKNFQLVELNGAASEPTHIYDPSHSIFFAWKELARHITYLYKISKENNKLGHSFLTHKKGMKEYKIHLEQFSKIIQF